MPSNTSARRPYQIPPVLPAATPPPPPMAGSPMTVQTPSGTGITSNGTGAYQQITLPDGTTAIVVPNGNGTSTVFGSDGTVQTIPTPK
jgi:hypothetical protein